MEDLLIRRKNIVERLMKNVVYRLTDYTCDGTANTAINTGIYLFDSNEFPNGWIIELEFYFTAFVSQGSVIRCRNAVSPYNGISTRNRTNTTQMEAQINGGAATVAIALGDRIKVSYDYALPSNTCSVVVNNVTQGTTKTASQSMSGKTVNPPLVVGGENAADAPGFDWKSGRFSKCHINSLVVKKK